MAVRHSWVLVVIAALPLTLGCAERPAQRAEADAAERTAPACPTVQPPALYMGGSTGRYHGTGALTQLKRRC
jgi:hypothetical protein